MKSLNAQAVQGRRAVQEYHGVANNLLKDIPDLGPVRFNKTVGAADIVHVLAFNEFGNNKRFKKFKRHFLWYATLVYFKIRADHDYRTAGIIDALAQKILTKTALLAF